MAVAQVRRHRAGAPGPDVGDGRVDPGQHRVALGRQRQVHDRLGEVDPRLRHADQLERGRRRDGDLQAGGVGHPDVLAGAHHEPAGDEARVLPRLDHPGQVVQRGVDVGAADALDEAADDVVVLVAVAVVAHRGAVDRPLEQRQREDRLDGGRLQCGQGAPRVAAGQPDEEVLGVRLDLDPAAEAALVGDGTAHHLAHLVVGQRLQGEQQAARQQRADDAEERVLRGGGDQRDPAVLHARQQRVLLRLGEAVHLVDEQHGLRAGVGQRAPRLVDDLADVLDAGGDRGQLAEAPAGAARDDHREGRLAGARRPPQDDRQRGVALHQAAQRRAGAEQVRLADHLVEGAGTHADGQRRDAVLGRPLPRVEQRLRVHARNPTVGRGLVSVRAADPSDVRRRGARRDRPRPLRAGLAAASGHPRLVRRGRCCLGRDRPARARAVPVGARRAPDGGGAARRGRRRAGPAPAGDPAARHRCLAAGVGGPAGHRLGLPLPPRAAAGAARGGAGRAGRGRRGGRRPAPGVQPDGERAARRRPGGPVGRGARRRAPGRRRRRHHGGDRRRAPVLDRRRPGGARARPRPGGHRGADPAAVRRGLRPRHARHVRGQHGGPGAVRRAGLHRRAPVHQRAPARAQPLVARLLANGARVEEVPRTHLPRSLPVRPRPLRALAVTSAVLGGLLVSSTAPASGAAPQFDHLRPGADAHLVERLPVNVVLLGYDAQEVDSGALRRALPATSKPIVRSRSSYGIDEEVGITFRYDYQVRSTADSYEDRFFAELKRLSRRAPLTLFQDLYNDQENNSRVVRGNHTIDAPSVERWLAMNPPEGVDTRRNTVYLIDWSDRGDFEHHVYTKTGEPDPDTGYDFGKERDSRKLIAWGGTTADDEETGLGATRRVWFHDASAGPESWAGSWNVDDADLDGDGQPDYRIPPVWEYGKGRYRPAAALTGDLARLVRFVAVDLLFTPSPLYPADLPTPDGTLPETINLDSNTYEGDPQRNASRDFITRPLVLTSCASCCPASRSATTARTCRSAVTPGGATPASWRAESCYPQLGYPSRTCSCRTRSSCAARRTTGAGSTTSCRSSTTRCRTPRRAVPRLRRRQLPGRHAVLRLQPHQRRHHRVRLRAQHHDHPRGRAPRGAQPPARRLRRPERHALRPQRRLLLRLGR